MHHREEALGPSREPCRLTAEARRQGALPCTEPPIQLAAPLETPGKVGLAHGGGNEALLRSMAEAMGTCTPWVAPCPGADMDARCAWDDGCCRMAPRLAHGAAGIADGRIPGLT
jgi:hypothetical protein